MVRIINLICKDIKKMFNLFIRFKDPYNLPFPNEMNL